MSPSAKMNPWTSISISWLAYLNSPYTFHTNRWLLRRSKAMTKCSYAPDTKNVNIQFLLMRGQNTWNHIFDVSFSNTAAQQSRQTEAVKPKHLLHPLPIRTGLLLFLFTLNLSSALGLQCKCIKTEWLQKKKKKRVGVLLQQPLDLKIRGRAAQLSSF